jgi:hypothetical protein
MATNSLLIELQKPAVFDAFVQENMKLSTYVAEWKQENIDVEVCAAKAYRTYLADHTAAVVGSIIASNAGKPTHDLPVAGELSGAISRIADEWQLDNDRLQQYLYLEGRYNDRKAGYSAAMRETEFQKLVEYLFNPFEKAVIAPHKRIDALYFEGLFNGTQTVNAKNNTKSAVAFTYDLGVKTQDAIAVWSDKENAKPLDDIEEVVDYLATQGKAVQKIRMSRRTFRQFTQTKQIQDSFILKLGKIDVKNPGVISADQVNALLEAAALPTIQVEKDRFVTLADGQSTNLTVDNRVVFQCADSIASLKVSDPLEAIDALPNKSYSVYDNNLVGFWRSERGRFVDYDMYATPVFTGKNNYAILRTDKAKV